MDRKRALLSAYDKTGIVDFARGLEALGYEIVSTGGTSGALKAAGIAVTDISDVTGFPECLDGRVKTLHPLIHAGILAMRDNESHMKQLDDIGAVPVDIVVNNLYPFKQTIMKENVTLEDAIENIDIGGPSMLRAAAKNWQDVCVLVDPSDYGEILGALQNGGISREKKFALACKVFSHTAAYDAMITNYLDAQLPGHSLPDQLTLTFEKAQGMRYGENPHQEAAFYKEVTKRKNGLADAVQLHGKELSYNNINDANGALDMLKDLDPATACAVAVKHANPCGVGVGDTVFEAYSNAFEADPVSIYGGIVALNREVDGPTAEAMAKIFLEIVIAPAYTDAALAVLTKKKNLRVLRLPDAQTPNTPDMLDMKKVAGGLLVQKLDTDIFSDFKVVTRRAPTESEMEQLKLAWRVVKHVKSNGICLVKGKHTVGVGPGQTNRVTAIELAIKYAGDSAAGSVMASDAYLPFADNVDAAVKAGITAIIQPGGSIRDEECIKACDEAGIAMVYTGMRHFKH